jgi:hypothetical protein
MAFANDVTHPMRFGLQLHGFDAFERALAIYCHAPILQS